jgi:hypothetical protein
MENAVDALKMAFGVMVFVLALTISISIFTNARKTSDVILKGQDETEYYEYIASGTYDETTGEWVSIGDTRIVGIETVVPTLYKYYKENYTVVFLDKSGNPLQMYETLTEPTLWSGSDTSTGSIASVVSKYYDGNLENHTGVSSKDKQICAFDLEEETQRHEPWTGSSEIDIKNNLDAFLNGSTFAFPSGDGREYDYEHNSACAGGFIKKYGNSKFIEKIGEYNYDVNSTSQDTESNTYGAYADTIKNKKKRAIVYQLV